MPFPEFGNDIHESFTTHHYRITNLDVKKTLAAPRWLQTIHEIHKRYPRYTTIQHRSQQTDYCENAHNKSNKPQNKGHNITQIHNHPRQLTHLQLHPHHPHQTQTRYDNNQHQMINRLTHQQIQPHKLQEHKRVKTKPHSQSQINIQNSKTSMTQTTQNKHLFLHHQLQNPFTMAIDPFDVEDIPTSKISPTIAPPQSPKQRLYRTSDFGVPHK